jgi:hypothetical protein
MTGENEQKARVIERKTLAERASLVHEQTIGEARVNVPPLAIKYQQSLGYQYAGDMEKEINSLLQRWPLERHLAFWATFTRTIRTSLDIIDDALATKRGETDPSADSEGTGTPTPAKS